MLYREIQGLGFGVQVPARQVHAIWMLVIVVPVLGKYIRLLGTWTLVGVQQKTHGKLNPGTSWFGSCTVGSSSTMAPS